MEKDWIVRWDRLAVLVLFLIAMGLINRCAARFANIIVPPDSSEQPMPQQAPDAG